MNVVEREGVSVSHPARFLLVGTMNEEEGELRPQIADRIGLQVDVEAVFEPWARAEIMRRREWFTADPRAMGEAYAGSQAGLAAAVERAAGLLPDVRVPDALYHAIAQLAVGVGVASHRADVTILECAKAIAALDGRTEVGSDDVLAAAELGLGHRLPADPFGPAPTVDSRVLRRLLDETLAVEVTSKKAS